MYKEFYQLTENPFSLNPDPCFLFPSQQHTNAFKYLMYGIKKCEGLIEVVGEIGCGKTLLCHVLLDTLGDSIKTAFILNPPSSEMELLQNLMEDLGLPFSNKSRQELLQDLRNFLSDEYAQGRNVVVVIDEAQDLSVELFGAIRLLSNMETEKKKLIQIILVGQPELEARLHSLELKALDQRIVLRYYLKQLNRKELKQYVYHRLKVAGSKDLKFTDSAFRKIQRFSGGVPRLINLVCDKALITGYLFKCRDKIDGKIIDDALKATQNRLHKRPSVLASICPRRVALGVACASVVLLVTLDGQFQKQILGWTRQVTPSLKSAKTSVQNINLSPIREKLTKALGETFSTPMAYSLPNNSPKMFKPPVLLTKAQAEHVFNKTAFFDSLLGKDSHLKSIRKEFKANLVRNALKPEIGMLAAVSPQKHAKSLLPKAFDRADNTLFSIKPAVACTDEVSASGQVAAIGGAETSSPSEAAAPETESANKPFLVQATSLTSLFKLWGKEVEPEQMANWPVKGEYLDFEAIAQQYGLEASILNADFKELVAINLPCIIFTRGQHEFEPPAPLFVAKLSGSRVVCSQKIIYPVEKLSSWRGKAVILWKDVDNLAEVAIALSKDSQERRLVLKRLQQLGYLEQTTPVNTQRVRKALKTFQKDHSLSGAALLGLKTKLVLYRIINQPGTPTLTREFI